jgi:hypothetical protein
LEEELITVDPESAEEGEEITGNATLGDPEADAGSEEIDSERFAYPS